MGFSVRACWTGLFRLVALGSRSSSTGLEEYYSCVTDRWLSTLSFEPITFSKVFTTQRAQMHEK